jgi:hypothetical protein
MGTSASYPGPTGRNPLLPPWAPPAGDREGEADGEVETQLPEVIPWSTPKSSLSRFATSLSRGSGNQGYLRSAIRDFVGSQGGSRSATRAARAGRASAQRLGGFLSSVVNNGATAAANSLGLQGFIGQDVDTLLEALVDRIAPAGALLEDSAARKATIQTLDELFLEYSVSENGLDALDALNAEDIKHAIQQCVANYIYTRLVQVMSMRIELRSTDHLIQVENAVKDYIYPTVRLDLMDKADVLSIDWNGKEGHDFIERIYQEGYAILESLL